MSTTEIIYIDRKCHDCGQTYKLHPEYQETLYAEYCASCFFNNVVEDIYGALRLKTQEEKDAAGNIDYRNKLQEVTHRGKTRTKKD